MLNKILLVACTAAILMLGSIATSATAKAHKHHGHHRGGHHSHHMRDCRWRMVPWHGGLTGRRICGAGNF